MTCRAKEATILAEICDIFTQSLVFYPITSFSMETAQSIFGSVSTRWTNAGRTRRSNFESIPFSNEDYLVYDTAIKLNPINFSLYFHIFLHTYTYSDLYHALLLETRANY